MADNSFSLVNFDGLTDLAKSLLEKISRAIGWVATRDTPSRIAVQTYIEDIKKSGLDPVSKAVLISNAKKTISEYSNQRSIVQLAIDYMIESAEPEKIEDDWLSQFMDKARLISDSDFQLIWGRILAEECNTPGSVPRSLLHILERMDKTDAERFTKLCAFSVCVIDSSDASHMPIIIHKHLEDYYRKNGIGLGALVDLKALGLIEFDLGAMATGYSMNISSEHMEIQYFDKLYLVPANTKELPVGNVLFTKTGQALCRAINIEEQKGFWDQYCIPFWNERLKKETLQTAITKVFTT